MKLGGGGGGDIKMCMALFSGKQHFQRCLKELLTSTNYYIVRGGGSFSGKMYHK